MDATKRRTVAYPKCIIRPTISFAAGACHFSTPNDGLTKGTVRKCLLVMIAIVALSLMFAGAYAQESKITVKPGEQLLIASSEKPLINKSGALKGKITTDRSGASPAVHRLLYQAPADVSTKFTEMIRFSENDLDREISVHVAPSSDPAALQSQQNSDGVYTGAFKVLFVVFILAILLESGLSVIFNWRPFLQNFDARGVKTIVSVCIASIFITTFKLDLVTDLINIYAGKNLPSNYPGEILTAFIIAGGSSGVNNLLIALGFRSVKTAVTVTPQPPPTEAWIAVRLIREKALGPVNASIGPEDGTTLPVAGTIAGSARKPSLLGYFLVDYGRFPVAGGYKVVLETGKKYAVELSGVDGDGKKLTSLKWGPYPLAPGAIIDIEMRL